MDELLRHMRRVTEEVDTEEVLRLGRESPASREEHVRLLEKIVERFMERGAWPETGRSAREEAERIEDEAGRGE